MIPSINAFKMPTAGGCAAKWSPVLLRKIVSDVMASDDENLLVGLAPFDDAAIYRISDDAALVSTTDFFPPLVPDPADFGAIAAANACSDVFAMGGRVVVALNVAAFPEDFPPSAIAAILTAGAETVAAAGGAIAGGHTIRNPDPLYGLAVQGIVHPDRIFLKSGARTGDVVMVSKPIGTGICLAAGSDNDRQVAIEGMKTLNRAAAETLIELGDAVHAVTDVTGYGLAGHAWEVAERSEARIMIQTSGLVAYPAAAEAADDGVRTGGDERNRAYLSGYLHSTAPAGPEALCFDPQTSGGLLAVVDSAAADTLAGAGFWRAGEVVDGEPGIVLV
ncbi:MAG: selenide, water dikinase SelD [Ilumatobacter coccineus]|uniref:Selenide, water dikinase SelD n=1 Tax=Ilumatobacter coccineus TaxID=467094 RepID=A0A2G6KB78_9ACTN|nr:MAG: selenide, water dikinase SelD [Ilumatobacter coccineus]